MKRRREVKNNPKARLTRDAGSPWGMFRWTEIPRFAAAVCGARDEQSKFDFTVLAQCGAI